MHEPSIQGKQEHFCQLGQTHRFITGMFCIDRGKDLAMRLVLIKKRQVYNTVFNCRNGDLNSPGSAYASIEQVFHTFLPDNIDEARSQGFARLYRASTDHQTNCMKFVQQTWF